MSKLSGKVALVTGSSRGIGAGIVRRLAADGASVAIHYRSGQAEAQKIADEITARTGRASIFRADIAAVDDIRHLFAEVKSSFGRLDVFVNNVGLPAPGMPIAETSEAEFDRVMAANAKGQFFALQEALRLISDGGRIINIGSSTTHFPTAGLGLYTMSKAVVQVMTAIAAREVGKKGVTVNTVSPGPTIPGMFEWAPEALRNHAAGQSPFNRLGAPNDIADVVAFLATDDARWITGQELLVNGGATI